MQGDAITFAATGDEPFLVSLAMIVKKK